jgi:hypothetical protein
MSALGVALATLWWVMPAQAPVPSPAHLPLAAQAAPPADAERSDDSTTSAPVPVPVPVPVPTESDDDKAAKPGPGASAPKANGNARKDTDAKKPPPPDRRRGKDGKGDKDDDDDDDNESALLWGGLAGCLTGGILPGGLAATGLSVFYVAQAARTAADICGALGFVGGATGALIAVPSLLLLGPCAAGGAGCGAAAGAVLSGKEPTTALWWSLPAVGLGLVGGGIASAGVLLQSAEDPTAASGSPLPLVLVGIGSALALASGPLAVGLAVITEEDADWSELEAPAPKGPRRDGVEASAPVQRPPEAATAAGARATPPRGPRPAAHVTMAF